MGTYSIYFNRKNKNPLYPKSYVLRVVENCFSLVHKYNLKHKDEPLRVYATYLEYLDGARASGRDAIAN